MDLRAAESPCWPSIIGLCHMIDDALKDENLHMDVARHIGQKLANEVPNRRGDKHRSTSRARHSRVNASTTLSTRIVRPAASTSCAKSSAHSWFAAVYTRSGELARTQCFRFF